MRFFMCFSYNGTMYHGSQIQTNGLSVQQVIEERMSILLQQRISIILAGRTDAGVHAERMWAHFDYNSSDCNLLNNGKTFVKKMNAFLPSDITVQHLFLVRDHAHARFSATKRTYEYCILQSKNPFYNSLFTVVPHPLDAKRMNIAAQILVGKHDFSLFCKKVKEAKSTTCTVFKAKWEYTQIINGTMGLIFHIEANRFLRNMVRAIVGAMLYIGKHKVPISQLTQSFATGEKYFPINSAPPTGLYLKDVEYDKNIFVKQLF